VDGTTYDVMADIHGTGDFAEYRAAIDAALEHVGR
jgi:hypothetical protein